jgi:hypothetical protein
MVFQILIQNPAHLVRVVLSRKIFPRILDLITSYFIGPFGLWQPYMLINAANLLPIDRPDTDTVGEP